MSPPPESSGGGGQASQPGDAILLDSNSLAPASAFQVSGTVVDGKLRININGAESGDISLPRQISEIQNVNIYGVYSPVSPPGSTYHSTCWALECRKKNSLYPHIIGNSLDPQDCVNLGCWFGETLNWSRYLLSADLGETLSEIEEGVLGRLQLAYPHIGRVRFTLFLYNPESPNTPKVTPIPYTIGSSEELRHYAGSYDGQTLVMPERMQFDVYNGVLNAYLMWIAIDPDQ